MVELKAVIQRYVSGHKHVEVIVNEGLAAGFVTHQVGVDIQVNRGRILTFLAAMYNIRPGVIVWPPHIKAVDSDV